MSPFEPIQNILLSLTSVILSTGLVILYIKIYTNSKEIIMINKKIEEKHLRLDQNELDDIRGVTTIDLDLNGEKQKNKRSLRQQISKFQRKKQYLMEEISIFKIFKNESHSIVNRKTIPASQFTV